MGTYDEMHQFYEELLKWMSDQGLKPVAPVREMYLNDPRELDDPKDTMTLIAWPVE